MKLIQNICIALGCVLIFQNCNTPNKESMKNNVTWFSIPTDDFQRSTRFYNNVFNWQIEPLTKEEDDEYSFHVAVTVESDNNYVAKKSGSLNGCIVSKKIGLPTPTILVEVPNLDAALDAVRKQGGKVVTEKVVMKSLNGVFALIQDPDGNYVEVFQNL